MTLIAELTNLTQCFGSKTVLENVTLQIQEGEILALLGPNGSGKTTLLKVLAFLLKPGSGGIKFLGEMVTDANSERMRLQSTLVFQRTVLFSSSVFNNVAYGLSARKIPKTVIEEEVRKTLKLVKLDGFEKLPAKKLSGGEQQRLALARALILRTKLLLLDEPAANLDLKNASILEEVISMVNREFKTTIVMATHNMFQAKTLPHRIALMDDGRITEVGTPTQIFGKLSKNFARFGAIENTFAGTARITDAGTTIVDVGHGVQIESAFERQGEITIFINPQDIIISKKQVESSARNVFKGRISQILDIGAHVSLAVDVGRLFTVSITKRSFREMALNLDDEVFIVFKASNVQTM